MKIWRADARCPGSDDGYIVKWFDAEEGARAWLAQYGQHIIVEKVIECVIPDDVGAFLEWLNEWAAVE